MKLIKDVTIKDWEATVSIPAGTELGEAVDRCMDTLKAFRKQRTSVAYITIGGKTLRIRVIPGLKFQVYQGGWRAMDDDLVILNLEFFLRREGWMRPIADASECPQRANA